MQQLNMVFPAEMVFGDPLLVSGEFFPNTSTGNDIQCLRNIVEKFAPFKQTYKTPDHRYIPKHLHTTKYVFLRIDAHTPPLLTPAPTKSSTEKRMLSS
ncbi:hypothetical protein Pcinc_010760 [Petrolisthes cinctipes]|uniref:Uncharacterized protein n=1 Tax=Petrolisthes cinctipes TaxID=88211 RepID=A0AAE1KV19_PETCI|nr:hypothetical protein Pcinc_010760 [Petrolisthes cinctipes]